MSNATDIRVPRRAPIALLVLIGIVAPGAADNLAPTTDAAIEPPLPRADRVVVRKSERRLYLMREDTVLRTFNVALGQEPVGHKLEEGDSRTPEGRYYLDGRNQNSDFFLSIHVSYPNSEDRRGAARRGVPPGGQIMIHGQPNEPKYSKQFYRTADWTDGCIAVSNSAMIDIWLMTDSYTPIDILP